MFQQISNGMIKKVMLLLVKSHVRAFILFLTNSCTSIIHQYLYGSRRKGLINYISQKEIDGFYNSVRRYE